AALKMKNFPANPAVGVTPASESMKTAIESPRTGWRKPTPAQSARSSFGSPLRPRAIRTAKAPRVMNEESAREERSAAAALLHPAQRQPSDSSSFATEHE